MPCHGVRLPGGGSAIVCGSRPSRNRKCACGRTSTLLCDWRTDKRQTGTCDAPLCDQCTTHPEVNGQTNFDKDLCPAHAAEFEKWKESKRETRTP